MELQAPDLPVVEPDQQVDLGTVEEGVQFEPGQVDHNPADDESGVPLPIPATGLGGVYTKLEAAKILAATKKGSSLRSEIMHGMIKQGYAPATIRTLQRLVQSYADGKVIQDVEWESQASKSPPPETCRGIQSSSLDDHAPSHLEYCRKAGWSVEADGQWHSRGCTKTRVGKDSRCLQCCNQWKKIGVCRHPELFQPPKAHSRLPSKSDIGIMVSERIGALGGLAVAADPTLNEAAGFLRMSKHDRVVLEMAPGKVSRVFVVCGSCPSFQVC